METGVGRDSESEVDHGTYVILNRIFYKQSGNKPSPHQTIVCLVLIKELEHGSYHWALGNKPLKNCIGALGVGGISSNRIEKIISTTRKGKVIIKDRNYHTVSNQHES